MVRNGIDLVEIERIRRSCENPAFLGRVFGDRERAEWEARGRRTEQLAGAFAAKEAFAKALGTGIRGFRLSEVEVLHDALGAPYFAFSGNAEALVQKRGLIVSLSITHTDALAAAMVTAQEKGDPTV